MVNNQIYLELINLGIIDESSIYEFYPKVRDNENVSVMRCKKSGVIFLNTTEHFSEEHYTDIENFNYWGNGDRNEELTKTYSDDLRRFKMIEPLIQEKNYLDFGCGLGGVLEFLKKVNVSSYGVEPQKFVAENLKSLGFNIFKSIDEVIESGLKFDVITLFHVFEHLLNPLETLEQLKSILNKDGILIIEVPHSNDSLITYYEIEEFKKSTFWSEHLILHTKESLKTYLEKLSFKETNVFGVQRYGLSNHINLIKNGKPGGQNKYKELNDVELNKIYSEILEKNNLTDTIISISKK